MKDENQFALLYGQIETALDFADLSGALAIASRFGESSHYAGGRYLRIAREEAALTFERIEMAEYLVSGEATCTRDLSELARAVSEALGQSGCKHRLEIYCSAEPSRLIGYFHHDWPPQD